MKTVETLHHGFLEDDTPEIKKQGIIPKPQSITPRTQHLSTRSRIEEERVLADVYEAAVSVQESNQDSSPRSQAFQEESFREPPALEGGDSEDLLAGVQSSVDRQRSIEDDLLSNSDISAGYQEESSEHGIFALVFA